MKNCTGHTYGSIRRRCCWALAIALVASAAWGTDVRAQSSDDVRAMLDRMERLERDIRDLNLQLSRGTVPPRSNVESKSSTTTPRSPVSNAPIDTAETGPAAARLAVRLTTLEDDVRNATGAMEEVQFRLGEIRKRLDKLVSDIDYRLGALESRITGQPVAPGQKPATPRVSAAPSPPPVQKVAPGAGSGFAQPPSTLGTVSEKTVSSITPPPTTPAAPSSAVRAAPASPAPAHAAPAAPAAQPAVAASNVLPPGDVKLRYDFAFGLLRQANYDQAELALQEFVRLYPKEPLTSNARYWLGETYYVRAAYVQAAEVFLEGYQADPKGPKAPDSLLKLGMALAGLDKKREACAAFDKLNKDFPNAPVGIKNTVTREKQKSGCP